MEASLARHRHCRYHRSNAVQCSVDIIFIWLLMQVQRTCLRTVPAGAPAAVWRAALLRQLLGAKQMAPKAESGSRCRYDRDVVEVVIMVGPRWPSSWMDSTPTFLLPSSVCSLTHNGGGLSARIL